MNKAEIQKEFDSFFEFPTDDRSIVTTTSALLFAKHCADKAIKEEHERQAGSTRQEIKQS